MSLAILDLTEIVYSAIEKWDERSPIAFNDTEYNGPTIARIRADVPDEPFYNEERKLFGCLVAARFARLRRDRKPHYRSLLRAVETKLKNDVAITSYFGENIYQVINPLNPPVEMVKERFLGVAAVGWMAPLGFASNREEEVTINVWVYMMSYKPTAGRPVLTKE